MKGITTMAILIAKSVITLALHVQAPQAQIVSRVLGLALHLELLWLRLEHALAQICIMTIKLTANNVKNVTSHVLLVPAKTIIIA